MKDNIFQELTNEELLKKRNIMKGLAIGFGIMFLLAIVAFVAIIMMKGSKGFPYATCVPFLVMPITMRPLLINFKRINKEIQSRNL
ncbi:hypothetical protein [Chryseobacterium sp.]|uniref:hypothetical protein n=1 Tax=Chryseobacterium sp. TaxID=1871047 RepID=UPI0025C02B5F|nr:hypothetical protein [Chryseobacterium sp.]MBV8327128.1 hypothetical protein [Chryseobacterium sp.]